MGNPANQQSDLEDLLLVRIAGLLKRTITRHGLDLIPVVAVGNGGGADLALRFLLRHEALLSACILLRPARPCPQTRERLSGFPVLLGRTPREEAVGAVGWQVREVLHRGGAEVVCERVASRRIAGGRDDAIARVFLATLYGANMTELP